MIGNAFRKATSRLLTGEPMAKNTGIRTNPAALGDGPDESPDRARRQLRESIGMQRKRPSLIQVGATALRNRLLSL